jgi:hypothetical protein
MPLFYFELGNGYQSNENDDGGVEFARASEANIAGAIALAHMFSDQLRLTHLHDRITMIIRDETRSPVARLTISCTVESLAEE